MSFFLIMTFLAAAVIAIPGSSTLVFGAKFEPAPSSGMSDADDYDSDQSAESFVPHHNSDAEGAELESDENFCESTFFVERPISPDQSQSTPGEASGQRPRSSSDTKNLLHLSPTGKADSTRKTRQKRRVRFTGSIKPLGRKPLVLKEHCKPIVVKERPACPQKKRSVRSLTFARKCNPSSSIHSEVADPANGADVAVSTDSSELTGEATPVGQNSFRSQAKKKLNLNLQIQHCLSEGSESSPDTPRHANSSPVRLNKIGFALETHGIRRSVEDSDIQDDKRQVRPRSGSDGDGKSVEKKTVRCSSSVTLRRSSYRAIRRPYGKKEPLDLGSLKRCLEGIEDSLPENVVTEGLTKESSINARSHPYLGIADRNHRLVQVPLSSFHDMMSSLRAVGEEVCLPSCLLSALSSTTEKEAADTCESLHRQSSEEIAETDAPAATPVQGPTGSPWGDSLCDLDLEDMDGEEQFFLSGIDEDCERALVVSSC